MKAVIILGWAMFASAATAQTPPTAAAAADAEARICVARPETGSRLGRVRTCLTRAQWAEHRRHARNTIEENQNNQMNPSGMSPGIRGEGAGRYIAGPARGNTPN